MLLCCACRRASTPHSRGARTSKSWSIDSSAVTGSRSINGLGAGTGDVADGPSFNAAYDADADAATDDDDESNAGSSAGAPHVTNRLRISLRSYAHAMLDAQMAAMQQQLMGQMAGGVNPAGAGAKKND